ncbi:MAG: hypothetical protein IJ666_07500 [Ruminococcus sp.]|nr:hypothetical protein [Ruminococcus sp.]
MSDYIRQSSKTILFEEFSRADGVPRLDFILRGDDDIDHENVKKMLTVHTFEEFMEKFDPKYYEYTDMYRDEATGEEVPHFGYTIDRPSNMNGVSEKCLADQPFYKAVMKIYEDKGMSGKNDMDFAFDEITSRVYDPSKAMKDAQDIRASLAYNYGEYQKLQDNGGNAEDKNYYAKEIKKLEKRIVSDYLSVSQFNLLPLAIKDTEDRIERAGGGENISESGTEISYRRLKSITFGSDGSPSYNYYEKSENDTLMIETSADGGVKSLPYVISNLFDAAAEKQKNKLVILDDAGSTKLMKNMIISVFGGKSPEEEDIPVSQLKSNLESYKLMYRASQQSFARGVVSLVEKILNVKALFDNAGGKADIIVSNCKIDALAENEKFRKFITEEGNNYTNERIWFSVIPSVYHSEFVEIEGIEEEISVDDNVFDDDIFGDDDEENTSSDKGAFQLVPFSSLKSALKLLGESDIITFFNFKGCDATAKVNAGIVRAYKRETESISNSEYGRYSVFCYPNFTVLPKRNTTVTIGNDTIKLPAVYADASYIACGLAIQSQNIDILKQKGFNINTGLSQPVRFDFEREFVTKYSDRPQLSQVFHTNMNRSKVMPWNSETKQEVLKDGGFGFCFCTDEKYYDYMGRKGIKQENAYVLKARTLGKDGVKDETGNETGEKRYRPLFKSMVNVYFEKLKKMLSSSQIKEECKKYMNTAKDCINNVVFSSRYSDIKTDEVIECSVRAVSISYDSDFDEVDLTVEEN